MYERILATAAGAALLGVSVLPVNAASSDIYFRIGDGSTVGESSPSGPVSGLEIHHYDYGSSYQHGAASAAHQTLRASAGVEQHGSEPPNSWITADTEAGYSKDIVVPRGVFGPPGTLISLPLSLRFDGRVLAEGGLFGDGRTLSSVDTYFSFEVQDLDEMICGEGCRPTVLAGFGFRGYASFDTGFGAAGRESVANYYWVAEQNGATVDEDSYDFYSNEPGVKGAGDAGYAVGTGVLNLQLDTRTGHTLRLVSSLDVFVQSMANAAWSNVIGDFGQTFDADLFLPAPGGSLEGETLGVYSPVPVPGAVWGLGSALAVLVTRRRRS